MLLTFFLFTLLIFVAAQVASAVWRWSYAVLLAAASLPVLGYEHASGAPMNYFQFVTMVDASSALGDALQMFAVPLALSAISAGMLLFGVGLAPAPRLAARRRLVSALPIAGLLAVFALIVARNGGGMTPLPASWAGTGFGAFYAMERLTGKKGPRKAVAIDLVGKPDSRDIVLIIDESVAGHYLDINSPAGVRSGLADPEPHIAAHNFGLAASITNCSMMTNVNLRFGGTRSNFAAHIATYPSIWSYAKKAGYTTVYLYGQRGGRNENYVTSAERKAIDESLLFDHIPDIDRDQAIAQRLARYLENDRREFILVNKLGAHFPVHRAYPPSLATYQPALPRQLKWLQEDDSVANRLSIIGKSTDWRQYRNSYRNTIMWTIGGFFDTLLAHSRLEKALVIYTSDHGQTFHERGNPGLATHCYSNPQVEELIVPLVVIESSEHRGADWASAARRNYNRSSQFRIFPSMLIQMGYDPAQVARTYGEALDAQQPDPMQSASEMSLWGSSITKWHKIDLADVIFPPATDLGQARSRNNRPIMQTARR